MRKFIAFAMDMRTGEVHKHEVFFEEGNEAEALQALAEVFETEFDGLFSEAYGVWDDYTDQDASFDFSCRCAEVMASPDWCVS